MSISPSHRLVGVAPLHKHQWVQSVVGHVRIDGLRKFTSPHCRVYKESIRAMDNRRVLKAYRNRAKENVLPYPSRSGLFSRVKRYFSGSSIPNEQQHEQTRRPTLMADAVSNRSAFILPESSTPANNTLLEADQSTNRVLSSFFQEKGDRPLSQIEYEGVMSLLEKSKASITLPIPESTPEKQQPPEADVSNVSTIQHNHTFAPYSQNMLRNTSMYEGNATSFVTPDYKPIYHTFADTSRGNIAVKRVYQFSGLPSPYRTRIKAPNMAARRARRLESLNQTSTNVTSTPSISAVDTTSTRVMSNTANSLLSILDGAEPHPEMESAEVSRPLHNPYAKNKKRTASVEARAPKRAALGADDIAKTVSFNKAEEVPQTVEVAKKSSVSVDATNAEPVGLSAPSIAASNTNGTETVPKETNESSNKSQPTFLFNQNSTSSTKVGESSQTLKDVASISKEVPSKPDTASDEAKDSSNPSDLFQSKPAFSFGAFKHVEANTPVSNGFSFGAKINPISNDTKTNTPKEAEPKKTFSFGLPAKIETNAEPLPKPAPTFSFGAKPSPVEAVETKTPGGFSFGSTQASFNPVVSGSNGRTANGNGSHFDFYFPPVETINASVDEVKVEQYKLMFEF